MSKSLGNFYTVQDVIAKGYSPLSLRYLYLQTHYRQEMNFTWESLAAADKALKKLRNEVAKWTEADSNTAINKQLYDKFLQSLNDDLNTASALAVLWELIKADIPDTEKSATLFKMDEILGLEIRNYVSGGKKVTPIPSDIMDLAQEREAFRKSGDWAASDELRKKIVDLGFVVEDSKEGPKVSKK